MITYQVKRDSNNCLIIGGVVTSVSLKKIKEKLRVMGYNDYKKLPIKKWVNVNILEL